MVLRRGENRQIGNALRTVGISALRRVVREIAALQFGGRLGRAENIALYLGAALLANDRQLLNGLHAFGRGRHSKAVPKLDDGTQDGARMMAVVGEIGDEA